jgi:hypothetical protein
MDDQANQSEQVAQPQQEQVVQPTPSLPQDQMLSKPLLIGLGALLLLGLLFFFFFYQNTFSTGQIEKSVVVTATPEPTHIPLATTRPLPIKTPKPTHTTLYAEDTVSVTLPAGWKDVSTSPLTMSYVSSDGALFSITIAPNTPVMTARERMNLLHNVAPDEEPYYDHQAVGNRYGLYYDNTYVVADDKYYWTILFQCKDDCTDALLNSLIFTTP